MKKLFSLFSLGLLVSCSHSTVEPVVTKPTPVKKTATAEELAQGKALYAEHCIKCHRIFEPSEFNAKKWNHEVPEMAQKAKIDSQKENLILTYVLNGAKP